MTEQYLKPPARFSHGLLLGLSLAVAAALASAIGQLPTLVVGLATAGCMLGGFWGVGREAWIWIAAGSVLVLVGAVGLVATPLLALAMASVAPTSVGVALRSVVALALLGGVLAILGDLVPDDVTTQDGPAFVAMLYGGALATGLVLVLAGVQLGVAALFGSSVSATGRAAAAILVGAASANWLTWVGSLVGLLGGCLWLGSRVAWLPLVSRGRRWLRRRVRRDPGDGDGAGTDEPAARTAPTDAARSRRWRRALRLVGDGLFYGGLAAVLYGASPVTTVGPPPVAAVRPTLESLMTSIAIQTALGWLFVGLLGLGGAHWIAWRARHVDWSAHYRRTAHLAGAGSLVLVVAVLAGPLTAFLLATPSIQYVPMAPSGPLLAGAEGVIELTLADPASLTIQHDPAVFVGVVETLRDLVGPAVLGIALVGLVVDLGTVLLVVVGIGAESSRLARPRSGIGLLFVGATLGALLGIPLLVAVGAAAAALLALDLHALGAGLAAQFDPAAPTLTGEIVHVVTNAFVAGLVVGLALFGLRAVERIPIPDAQWQLFGALALSLLAALLSLLVLGFRGDR